MTISRDKDHDSFADHVLGIGNDQLVNNLNLTKEDFIIKEVDLKLSKIRANEIFIEILPNQSKPYTGILTEISTHFPKYFYIYVSQDILGQREEIINILQNIN